MNKEDIDNQVKFSLITNKKELKKNLPNLYKFINIIAFADLITLHTINLFFNYLFDFQMGFVACSTFLIAIFIYLFTSMDIKNHKLDNNTRFIPTFLTPLHAIRLTIMNIYLKKKFNVSFKTSADLTYELNTFFPKKEVQGENLENCLSYWYKIKNLTTSIVIKDIAQTAIVRTQDRIHSHNKLIKKVKNREEEIDRIMIKNNLETSESKVSFKKLKILEL